MKYLVYMLIAGGVGFTIWGFLRTSKRGNEMRHPHNPCEYIASKTVGYSSESKGN